MRVFLLASFIALMVSGCGCNDRRHGGTTKTQVNTQSYLLNAEDFDLATVTGMVKSGEVSGGPELEQFINADNGINNVDVDGDGNIDFIRVVESRPGDSITLDFLAQPSSGVGGEKAIANLRLKHTSSEVVVEGGYPDYVRGYDRHYYSYRSPYSPGAALATAAFYAWAFSPTRVVYAKPYVRSAYRPRARYTSSQMTTKRTTVRKTTKAAPIKKASRPASFKPTKAATKTASKFSKSKPAKAKGNSITSRKGQSKAFTKRDAAKTKKKATGFGAAKKAPSSKTGGFGRSSSGSSGFGKKKKSSNSWNSKPKSKPRSSFGRSSSGRKSFGSKRRRR